MEAVHTIDLSHVRGYPLIPQDIISQFLNAMEIDGIRPKNRADLESQLQIQLSNNDKNYIRFAVEDDKGDKKSGSCKISHASQSYFIDGLYMDFRSSNNMKSWSCDLRNQSNGNTRERTPLEKAQYILSKARPADPEHTYLKAKGISGFGAKQTTENYKEVLLIPGCDVEGKLQTLQRIFPDGEKRFFAKTKKKGAFHRIAGSKEKICLCEGFATGATIAKLTGYEVIVCFDAGNLTEVAKLLPESNPDRSYIIFADNDHRTDGNPGLTKAKRTGLPYIYPQFPIDSEGTDWNDYCSQYGENKTSQAIKSKLDHIARTVSPIPLYKFPDLSTTGKPQATIENLKYLMDYYGIKSVYNEVSRETELTIPFANYSPDNIRNASLSRLQSLAAKCNLPRMDVNAYVDEIGDSNRYNPIKDWIESKPWDGVSRIKDIQDTLTVPDSHNEFTGVLLKKWLISAVAAQYQKDFRCRGALVLQGDQSIGKTTWLKSLVGPMNQYFKEGAILNSGDKDHVTQSTSKWIVELGELESTFKKSDIGRIKAFLTNSDDEVRTPYAKLSERHKRRTVFSASVNDIEFLRDLTGNSRWWVIPCKAINYNHNIDVQQLWAEVYDLYKSGSEWWLTFAEEKKLENLNRGFEITDPLEAGLDDYFDFRQEPIKEYTLTDVFELIGIQEKNGDRSKLGKILKKKGISYRKVSSGLIYKMPRPFRDLRDEITSKVIEQRIKDRARREE